MRITRLKLQHWRNFRSAEIKLSQRSFFVGPNASGKSNLLDALRFLKDIVSDGGGFQSAVAKRGGVGEIRCLAARQKPSIVIEFDLGDDSVLDQWTYTLEFSHGTAQNSKKPHLVREVVRRHGKRDPVLSRPDRNDIIDPVRLEQTALEQVNSNKTFRDIADFFASVRYLHVVPEIIRDPSRSSGGDDPFGGDLISRINATAKKTRDPRLKRMEEALRVAVPQLSNLELIVDDSGVPHLHAKYRHWRPQGAWQRENRFSDGTLRLLGLIWSLQESGGPVLLEEPEMSLNPAIVQRLAPMIARATARSKRQSFITTHSVELLSDGVALDEVHLLQPGHQGTDIHSGVEQTDVQALLEGGVPLGEAIMPKTKAQDADRLPLLELMSQ